MELRDLMLILHIAGAGTWLGANVVQMVVPRMALAQDPVVAAGWMRIGSALSRLVYMPASMLILVTGIVMVLQSPVYTFASVFVLVGLAVIVIGAVLGIVVFGPGADRAAAAIESGDQSRIKTVTGRLAGFGALDTLLILTAIAVMVLRLG